MSIYGQNHEKYLASLTKGTYVFVGNRQSPRVAKISKITATQIVTSRINTDLNETKPSETRYNKQSGRERSSFSYYGNDYILPDVPTVEQIAAFEVSEANSLKWREEMRTIIAKEQKLASRIGDKLGIDGSRISLQSDSKDRKDTTTTYKVVITSMSVAEIESL